MLKSPYFCWDFLIHGDREKWKSSGFHWQENIRVSRQNSEIGNFLNKIRFLLAFHFFLTRFKNNYYI